MESDLPHLATEQIEPSAQERLASAKKPIHQRVIIFGSYTVVGIVGLGAVLSAFSSSIALVTPLVTYVGIGLILVSWIVLFNVLHSHPVMWVTRDKKSVRLKRLGMKSQLALFGMILLLLVPRVPEAVKRYTEKERQIPELAVKIVNHRSTNVEVYYRGEFILWLPRGMGGLRTTQGTMELRQKDRKAGEDYTFVVPAHGQTVLLASFLNSANYFALFEAGDTDLSIAIRTVDGEAKISDGEIPFGKQSFSHTYQQIDIPDK